MIYDGHGSENRYANVYPLLNPVLFPITFYPIAIAYKM